MVPVTTEEEKESILSAMDSSVPSPVRDQMHSALKYLRSTAPTDWRNAVKDSVGAVETIAQTIDCSKKPLGKILDGWRSGKLSIHPSLVGMLDKLYGYATDTSRHALNGTEDITLDETRFVVVSASAAVNYLINKFMRVDGDLNE